MKNVLECGIKECKVYKTDNAVNPIMAYLQWASSNILLFHLNYLIFCDY